MSSAFAIEKYPTRKNNKIFVFMMYKIKCFIGRLNKKIKTTESHRNRESFQKLLCASVSLQ
jgi:hypothetical protein